MIGIQKSIATFFRIHNYQNIIEITVIFFKVILRKRQSLHLLQLQIFRHFTKMEKHHHPTCPFGLVSVNPDVTHTHYLSPVCPNTQ